ncbi:5,6-dimethylbenzimidazole synthase [Sulfitobacter sp. DSM 110093]|uniref:5,6-dimethylbenzimidazole synthase n=1 Tax=Sulfitobacter sp. DSM 110093 TaxID=2883127 RepID=UPI001FAD0381|nr:5,6-dimethylbenzimidazole synthase [Sulfitobacter sp. DSM 110093]UOA33265.1 5,6-dimethylbenzimidazole synthase [Sulfitobacter sp. DSM 110093]
MDEFSEDFRAGLHDLMRWRRDVRRFRTDPLDEALVQTCLDSFALAPSVGLSEPWRIIRVQSDTARQAALENFETANARALAGYDGDKAALYAGLKLSGMSDAPEQFAIYCDDSTEKGSGLGAGTMPEMRRYSVVGAISLMWLTARAHGLGLGWVSVLDPARLNRDLDVPKDWSLVAYLCMGWPQDNSQTPELETKGWETRAPSLKIEAR